MRTSKLKKSLLLLLMASMTSGAFAQTWTDVTSTYLTNADFEGTYSEKSGTGVSSDRAIYEPDGWTVTYVSGNSNDMTILSSGDKSAKNFTDNVAPLSPKEGNNTYWYRGRWGANTEITVMQEIELPAGQYKLSCDAWKSGLGGDGKIIAGDKSASLDGNAKEWRALSLIFNVPTKRIIKLGFELLHTSENADAKFIGFDNFKLEQILIENFTSDNPLNLTDQIVNPSFEKDGLDGWTNNGMQLQNNSSFEKKDGTNYAEKWQPSGTNLPNSSLLQTITNLPNGLYKLTVAAGFDGNGAYIAANDNKTEIHANGDYSVMTNVVNGNLTIGVKLENSTSNYIRFDNFRLEYCGNPSQASSSKPLDLTSMVGSYLAAWKDAGGYYSNCVEHFIWGGTATGEYLSQTVSNLPIGKYEVELYCAASSTSKRDNDGTTLINPDGSDEYVTISANGVSLNIPAYNRTTIDGDIPSYKLENVTVSDGTLKLSVDILKANPNWIVANIKSLKYLGVDLSSYQTALSAVLSTANAIDENSVPTAVATILANAIQQGEDADENDQASLEEAISALNDAITMANNVKETYKALTDLIAACNEIKNNSEPESADAKTTFATAITNADASSETTAEAINAKVAALESARQTYVKVADPINGKAFDYTFIVSNPSFETGNTNGWTLSGGSDVGAKENANATYTMTNCDGNYLFNVWGNPTPHKISQEVSVPRDGLYELSAVLASDAGSELSLLLGSASKNVTIAAEKGIGTVYTTDKVSAAGKITIGVSSDAWYKADNFRLMFYGFDKESAVDALSDLISSAYVVIADNMNKDVAEDLNEAISAANDISTSNTKTEIVDATKALQDAVEAANASIAAYQSIFAALSNASSIVDGFDGDGKAAYDVSDIQTAYDNGTIEGDGTTELSAIKAALRNAAVAQASGADLTFLLVNPSFEEGTTGWTNMKNTTGSYDYRIDTANPAHGNNTLNAWASQVNYINVWQKVVLPAGVYQLSAKARTDKEPLEDKTQVRTYVNGSETSHSAGLTYDASATYAWNSQDAWQTLTTTFALDAETEVEMGIYSTGKNIPNNSQGWYQVDDFRLEYLGQNAEVTINAYNYASFSSKYELAVPEGVEAFYASACDGTSVTMTKIEDGKIPANTGVVLKAESDTYTLSPTTGATAITGNLLVAVTTAINGLAATEGSNTNYVLKNGQFVTWTEGVKTNVAAGKAYLSVPSSSAALSIDFGDATAINTVNANTFNGARVNLAGQVVGNGYKGIVIENGKKVLVK